jgi:arylesterase/paraoxonase
MIEDYLNVPRASIFHYDGSSLEKIARPYHYANGINSSPDGSKLYLAETTGKAITTFEIKENGDLVNIGSYDVGTGVDNIDIDEEGNLWVAAHPKMLDFIGHTKDSINFSPSQVIKLKPVSDFSFEEEIIYENSGQELSASSVAVIHNNELFIGVVFNRTILRARLN